MAMTWNARLGAGWALAGVAVGVAVLASAWRPRAPMPGVAWSASLAQANERARREARPMLLVFHMAGCAPCRRLEEEVLPRAEVRREMRGFVCVEVDVNRHPDFSVRYGVLEMPTLVALRPDGSRVDALPGYREAGEVAGWLRACRVEAARQADERPDPPPGRSHQSQMSVKVGR